jgi:pilus assembly protein CpaF
MSLPDWLGRLLIDESVTDICLNGPDLGFFDRGHGLEPILGGSGWSADAMRSWALDQLSQAGKTWDARHPFVDATLASGHRIHLVFPPVAKNGILVSLRRISSQATLARWSQSPYYPKLAEIVRKGDSLLISGSTGSGKTTLANDLLAEVPAIERIVALEDTPELHPRHPHFLSLVSRPANADGFGEVSLRALLRQTLRMRPDRIVLGECRGVEVLELLQALNTGHRGALTTLHSNSAREALRRIELLCLLASGGAIPISAIRELLALGVQWLVQVKREGPHRIVSELWRIEGREGDTLILRPVGP